MVTSAFRDAFPAFMKKQKEDSLIPTVADLRAALDRIKGLEADKAELKLACKAYQAISKSKDERYESFIAYLKHRLAQIEGGKI